MKTKPHSTGNKEPRLGKIGHRPFWVFSLAIVLRAIHQIGAAVFLASFLLPDVIALPPLYLYLAMFSGVALLAAEWLRHREIHREFAGLATLVKLLLLGLAYHALLPATGTVIVAFVLASIGSHLPKKYRHRLLY